MGWVCGLKGDGMREEIKGKEKKAGAMEIPDRKEEERDGKKRQEQGNTIASPPYEINELFCDSHTNLPIQMTWFIHYQNR